MRRITLAATDLAKWPQRSVMVLELEDGHDAGVLAAIGRPADVSVAGVAGRCLPDAAWPHPFAVLDARTIVTGDAELLQALDARREIHLTSATFARLMKTATWDSQATLLVDLSAARDAGWQLPAQWLDVWPPGKQAWHVVCEMPVGLGCTVRWSDRSRIELALVCEGETAAEQVRAAVDGLIPAAGESLAAEIESLPAKLQAGELTAAAAQQYGSFLKQVLAASRTARCEVAEETAWVRADCGEGPATLAVAAVDVRPLMQAQWREAARVADEANHGRLLTGLGGRCKAEGSYPAAAAGGAMLPPETRLSWIAAMLPYYDHADWHGRLEFGYPWNGVQNQASRPATAARSDQSGLGPGTTEAGFSRHALRGRRGRRARRRPLARPTIRGPACSASVGTTRPEQHPRRRRATRSRSWASAAAWGPGRPAETPTVRSLTQRPYVNGPDGFGSGQPDGMLAGMADGSVRFISKDIDPQVVEQLATIAGREAATAVALDPAAKPAQPPANPPAEAAAQPLPAAKPSDLPPVAVAAAAEKPAPPPDTPPVPPVPAKVDAPVKAETPVKVDVPARLADVIPEIRLEGMPLVEAVGLLATMSGLPITFDPDAMQQLGLSTRDPVTVQLTGATVARSCRSWPAAGGLSLSSSTDRCS